MFFYRDFWFRILRVDVIVRSVLCVNATFFESGFQIGHIHFLQIHLRASQSLPLPKTLKNITFPGSPFASKRVPPQLPQLLIMSSFRHIFWPMINFEHVQCIKLLQKMLKFHKINVPFEPFIRLRLRHFTGPQIFSCM